MPGKRMMTLSARLGSYALRLIFRVLPSPSKRLLSSGADIIATTLWVPTRHANVRCLIYQRRQPKAGGLPPVYISIHGGAFIVRAPAKDEDMCRFIASTTDAVVISVDYDTAPGAVYPVAEHEVYDVFQWVHRNGRRYGWDGRRLAVGGFSAGAKLAINVYQQARDAGTAVPIALVACYPALDMTLTPASRRSALRHPAVGAWLIRLMYATYFVDQAKRGQALASPALDHHLSGYPPTLLLIGGLDSLADEAEQFADKLAFAGVRVSRHYFAQSDHGFTHNAPAAVANSAAELIRSHLDQAFSNLESTIGKLVTGDPN
jgi:acetyl esterase